MNKPRTRFGEIIREARIAKGMTRTDLAKKIKISRIAVFYWEKERRKPNYPHLLDISTFLGVDVNILNEAYNIISLNKIPRHSLSLNSTNNKDQYRAEEKLLDGYCGLIKIRYHTASEEEKTKIRSALESLVN